MGCRMEICLVVRNPAGSNLEVRLVGGKAGDQGKADAGAISLLWTFVILVFATSSVYEQSVRLGEVFGSLEGLRLEARGV